jgi:hypothetical protein
MYGYRLVYSVIIRRVGYWFWYQSMASCLFGLLNDVNQYLSSGTFGQCECV